MNYGYVRVSTKEQNEARQVIALSKAGILKQNIFIDKQSGKNFNRKKYILLMNTLSPGDTLFIKSIDRLGRNYDEILEQWRFITKELRVAIVILDMPLLDTRRQQDLTGVLISDIVLQLFSYVAETERNFIRQRQAEGIAAAREKGVQFGRKPKPLPDIFQKVFKEYRNGRLSVSEAAHKCGMKRSTFYYYAKKNLDFQRSSGATARVFPRG